MPFSWLRAETSTLRLGQLARESVVYGLSGVVSRFISVLLVPVYTRVFMPEDFGVISLVSATVAAASLLAGLALDNSAHRWFWDTEQEDDRKRTLASWAWCQLPLAALFATGVFLLAEPLGRWLVGRADAGLYFRLAAPVIPLAAVAGVLTNWLRMQRRAPATVAFALGTSSLNVALTVGLVVGLGWGLVGVYAAQLASGAVGALFAVALLGDWIHPRHVGVGRLVDMLRYALPLVPSAVAYWVTSLSDRYVLQLYATTADVGLYQLAATIAATLGLATTAFQQAWGPFALSIHRQEDAPKTYAAALVAYCWVTCLLATGLSLLTPEAIRLVATEAYLGASVAVPYLAFGYVLAGLTYVAALGPSLAKTTQPVGLALAASAGLSLALNLLLVPRLGLAGAGLAALVAQAVPPLYLFARSQRLYPIPYRFGAAALVFGAAFLLVALGTAWEPPDLWTGLVGKAALLALFLPLGLLLRRGGPGLVLRASRR